MRVALLTNIPSPYRVPLFRALAATPGWELRVLLSALGEFDRSWNADLETGGGLDARVVRGFSFRRRQRTRGPGAAVHEVTVHVPWGAPLALERFRPDVVVSAELGARTLLALLWCRLRGVPLVVWSYHSAVSATAAGPARRALWRALLARADAVVGMGAQARAVLRSLGVEGARIFDAPNAHDAGGLARALAGLSAGDAAGLRRAHRLRERVALVPGRLVPSKGVEPLLAAWRELPAALRRDWTLLFVGDGPLAPAVERAALAGEAGEIARVPAVQPAELAAFYAACRLVLFPSLGDPWGLVVNEAFAAARPVLCSRLAGCADDLVRPGKNGWLVDPTDPAELAKTLADALSSPRHAEMGAAAAATIAGYTPDSMAAGLRRAIQSASGRS